MPSGMASKSKVPDAWDDDWADEADNAAQSTEDIIESLPKLSKAERRAKQAELNKRLWEEAETPQNNFYVETRNSVPLQTEFKPAVKVLSRKPTPTLIARKDPTTGVEQLTIEDDEEDEESRPKPLTMEERQAKAQREREEKQRKYEEARQRLFGASSPASGSRPNTPQQRATSSPTRASSEKVKGKGRGGLRSNSGTSKSRQLYDPQYKAKPDSSYVQKIEAARPNSPLRSAEEENIMRQPLGPDGSGKGGHGFGRPRHRP